MRQAEDELVLIKKKFKDELDKLFSPLKAKAFSSSSTSIYSHSQHWSKNKDMENIAEILDTVVKNAKIFLENLETSKYLNNIQGIENIESFKPSEHASPPSLTEIQSLKNLDDINTYISKNKSDSNYVKPLLDSSWINQAKRSLVTNYGLDLLMDQLNLFHKMHAILESHQNQAPEMKEMHLVMRITPH